MPSLSFPRHSLPLAFGLALIIVACGPSTPSPETAKTSTGESVAETKIRGSIEAFLRDPKKGKDASAILNFVGESSNVLVVFRESILSAEGSTTEIDQLMLVAFSAGNVRAQLDASTKEDMPLAGVRAMAEAYGKLKEKDPSLEIAKFEDYAARAKDGTLDAHVAELAAK